MMGEPCSEGPCEDCRKCSLLWSTEQRKAIRLAQVKNPWPCRPAEAKFDLMLAIPNIHLGTRLVVINGVNVRG